MSSSPVGDVQRFDGMETDAGSEDVSAPSGSAFHLAKLWPIIAWTAFRCRRCNEFVAQVDADPWPNPPGWCHREGECPT